MSVSLHRKGPLWLALGGDLMCVAFKSFWEQAPDLESKSSGGKRDPYTACEA